MSWLSEIKRIWVEIPETKKLQKFGLLISGMFIFLGFLFTLEIIVFFGFTILGVGITAPIHLSSTYKLWMSISVLSGHITNQLTLIIIFIFVIIPVGLLRNLLRDQSISKSLNKKNKSYWKKYTGINNN